VNVTDVTIRDGELSLFVSVTGSGPPLLWVAGLGDDHSSWASQVPRFTTEYTCIVFDNRGCGLSSTPPGPYTIGEMAQDVHLLLAELDTGPVTAIGSSMGGAICQELAAAHPADLSGMVLSNTWAVTDNFTGLLFDHWTALADAGDADRLAESAILFSLSARYMDAEGVEIPPLTNMPGFAAAARACRGHDSRPRLGSISAPTLVVVGEHDILTRPDLARPLAQSIPGAHLALVDAGHMLFWEKAEEFSTLLRDFLPG
jgi:3-oxoadipate enol-lactonase